MSKKVKESKKMLKKKQIMVVAIIIIAIICIILIVKNVKKSTEKLDDFEQYAINNYLQDNVLDVFTLYNMAGKIDYDETQIFQAKLKTALDTYFSENKKSTITTAEAVSLVDEDYVPENIDFHGIIISGYEYDEENDTLKKSSNSNYNMAYVENEINSVDYSDKKVVVESLKKISDTKYKVYFKIVDNNSIYDDYANLDNSDNTANGNEAGTAVISLEEDTMKLETCEFDE